MAKSVARQLATAALWVLIQTSLKNHKWATNAKEWPTHSSPPKKYTKKIYIFSDQKIVIYLSLGPPQRTSKLQKKPSALKIEHPALQKNEIY